MANLDLINGVSFTKGCYPGQEIVARMHYLGKLKQRMYLAAAPDDELPQPGDKLYGPDTGEQATGMIVNAARGPTAGRRRSRSCTLKVSSAVRSTLKLRPVRDWNS